MYYKMNCCSEFINNTSFNCTNYTVSKGRLVQKINSKGCGRTGEIYEKCQDGWFLDHVSNMEYPEYKAEVTVTQPEHLVQYDYDWWIKGRSHGLLLLFPQHSQYSLQAISRKHMWPIFQSTLIKSHQNIFNYVQNSPII